jgi:hypothetical protein
MPSEPCRYQPPKIVPVKVKVFDACGPEGEATHKEKTIHVLAGTESSAILQYEKMFDIEALQCKPVEAIAAVPDWWQVRIEGRRPQLVMQFGEVLPNGKIDKAMYVMTIPHYIGGQSNTPPVGRYQKGSIEGILTLSDNSKLIVNAISEKEAERVLFQLKQVIDPNYLNGSLIKIGMRRGQALRTITVSPRYGKFFPQGLESMKPQWTAYYGSA